MRVRRGIGAGIVVALTAFTVGGCSSVGLSYPKASDFERITKKLLTPKEQREVIDDLSMAHDTQRSDKAEKPAKDQ